MRLTLRNTAVVSWGMFDYCRTGFDDGVVYAVYYGGTQPLRPGRNGVLLGDVARFVDDAWAWFATPDSGDAVSLRWYGRFTSRAEAALFLLGMKFERDIPARSVVGGVSRALGEVSLGRLEGVDG